MISRVLTEAKLPVKMWLKTIESGALEQVLNLANLPFTYKHVALMPDAHQGYGMPIGGVLATRDVIIPNAVGVDIGCGMLAIKTGLQQVTHKQLESWVSLVRHRIPLGHKHHKQEQPVDFMPSWEEFPPVVQLEFEKARTQLGTLGGGNHFIELQKGSDDKVYFMVHSGSRNLGKQVADFYNTKARELNERWHTKVPREYNLAFLPIENDVAQAYIQEMNYCIAFAEANRSMLIAQAVSCLEEVLNQPIEQLAAFSSTHNFARRERVDNIDVLVHRKGATSARKGEWVVIPGSQGARSFIGKGLGNRESFYSCSHGAGRRMGRKQAQKTLDLAHEQRHMDNLGIVHAINSVKALDEAPGAYKDIEEVMQLQADLVKVEVALTPMAVVKG